MGKKILKEQFTEFNISVIDLLELHDPTESNKYLPFLCKEIKKGLNLTNENIKEYSNYSLNRFVGANKINPNKNTILTSSLGNMLKDLVLTSSNIDNIFNIIVEFEELSKKNQLPNSDIYSYENLSDITKAISEAEYMLAEKELKNERHIVYEDDKYKAIMPLTYEASLKYGATTKWCTASKNDKETFFYTVYDAILIYVINKKTNSKLALAKTKYDENWVFYDEKDRRLNILSKELDIDISILRKITTTIEEETTEDFISKHYPKLYSDYYIERKKEALPSMPEVNHTIQAMPEEPLMDVEVAEPDPVNSELFDTENTEKTNNYVLLKEDLNKILDKLKKKDTLFSRFFHYFFYPKTYLVKVPIQDFNKYHKEIGDMFGKIKRMHFLLVGTNIENIELEKL